MKQDLHSTLKTGVSHFRLRSIIGGSINVQIRELVCAGPRVLGKTKTERERGRERGGERGSERERVCTCIHVHVHVYMYVCVTVNVCKRMCVHLYLCV